MKVTGTGQFNRKVELFNGDEVYRENNINGVSPFNSPSPKDNIPAYGPKVQLRDEKMSDNASVSSPQCIPYNPMASVFWCES